MNAVLISEGPSLPLYLSVPAALLWIVATVLFARTLRDRLAMVLVLAFLLRYLLAAFHEFTFRNSPLGLSWNALGSLAVLGVGLLLIDRRSLALRFLVPLYALVAIATISALVNGDTTGFISAVTKYAFLVIVILMTYQALQRVGTRLMPVLLVTFSGPIIFQILSIAFHVTKASETDGSASIIGGFAHEAPFSIILGTGILIAALSRQLRPMAINALIVLFVIAMFIANYRTSILAVAPLVVVQLLTSTVGSLHKSQRVFGLLASAALAVAALGVVGVDSAQRFADLARIADLPRLLTEPTNEMTRADVRMFSGRVKLWNINLHAYRDGPAHGLLLGAGPEERAPGALLYPHNTLVAALYETGALGALALLMLWGGMIRIAWRVRSSERAMLVAAHIGFIVLNMATMPFFYIEGMLFYGALCGYTYHSYRISRPVASARRADALRYAPI